jgi:hypothetical protein
MSCVGVVYWCLPSSKAGYELCCLLAWRFFDSSYSLAVCDWLSQSHIATDGQSVPKSWCQAPSGTHGQIISYYYLTVTVLFLWGALSDERTGLSFVYAVGCSQHRLSRVWVPWYSRPYITFSDLRLPISSPLMTHRVTVEVCDWLFSSIVLRWT